MSSNIAWYKKLFLISFIWLAIAFIWWCYHVPKMSDTKQDEKEMSDKLQQEREQLNYEIGKRAHDRLKEKYGDY